MTITDDKLRELIALCEKATPGPWYDVPNHLIGGRSVRSINIPVGDDTTEPNYDSFIVDMVHANCVAFIAACDPATIKAMAEELLSARTQLALSRSVLRFLDHKGGLGHDVHNMVRNATPLPRPPYPEFCRKFEECAATGRCMSDPCCAD